MQTQLLAAHRSQQPLLDVVGELQALATCTRVPSTRQQRGVRYRPSIAVTVDLLAGGRGKGPREGTVRFTVSSPLCCQRCSAMHVTLRIVSCFHLSVTPPHPPSRAPSPDPLDATGPHVHTHGHHHRRCHHIRPPLYAPTNDDSTHTHVMA